MMSQILITARGTGVFLRWPFSTQQLSLLQHCHVTYSYRLSVSFQIVFSVVTCDIIAIVHFYTNVSLQIRKKTLMRED